MVTEEEKRKAMKHLLDVSGLYEEKQDKPAEVINKDDTMKLAEKITEINNQAELINMAEKIAKEAVTNVLKGINR